VSENSLNLGAPTFPANMEKNLSHEDVLRAHERFKVLKARAAKRPESRQVV
jgi:hypothetical protein